MFESRFQSFVELGDPSHGFARVSALRAELAKAGLAGFIVPRADEHQNEYVPAKRRAAEMADRICRLGRDRGGAEGRGGAVRRRPLHGAGGEPGGRLGVRVPRTSSTSRRPTGSRAISSRATSSAMIPGCIRPTPSSASPHACEKAGGGAGCGRLQPDRRDLARSAAGAGRRDHAARAPLRRRKRGARKSPGRGKP